MNTQVFLLIVLGVLHKEDAWSIFIYLKYPAEFQKHTIKAEIWETDTPNSTMVITKIDQKCRGIDFTELSFLEANLQVAISSETETLLFLLLVLHHLRASKNCYMHPRLKSN